MCTQVRLALELVFEGLQAAGLPGGGGGSGGVTGNGTSEPQQSLRIGDAVTVTLASAPQRPSAAATMPPSAKQSAAKPGASAAATAAKSAAEPAKAADGGPAMAASAAAPHLLVEWEGGALPDMLADAVIAVLLQVHLKSVIPERSSDTLSCWLPLWLYPRSFP